MARERHVVAALAVAACCLLAACSSSSTSTTAPSGDKCSITAATSPSSFAASGGSGSVSIQTSRDCTWSVVSDASWLSIAGAGSGQGAAVVPYSVAPNPAPSPRSAALSVGPQRLPVSQAAAPCVFTLSSRGDTVGAVGGRLSVGVTTIAGCAWSASSSAPWVTITSGQSGNSSGTVGLSVAANTGAARTTTVDVAHQAYTVSQAAAPSPGPTPSPAPSPSPTPPAQVTVSGIVLSLAGKCPGLTFTVGADTVTTDSNTTYRGGKCGDVKIGRSVTVTGTRGSTGVIAAAIVQFNG